MKLEAPAQLMVRRANSDSEYAVENESAVKEVKEALRILDARAEAEKGTDGGLAAKLQAPAFARAGEWPLPHLRCIALRVDGSVCSAGRLGSTTEASPSTSRASRFGLPSDSGYSADAQPDWL